jgi:hypothetical protein
MIDMREGFRVERVRLSEFFGLKNDTKKAPDWMKEEVLKLFGQKCAGCPKRLAAGEVTMDHMVPLSKGGLTEVGNIQPLCTARNVARTRVRVTEAGMLPVKMAETARIDAVSASLTALAHLLVTPPEPASVYETRGILVV